MRMYSSKWGTLIRLSVLIILITGTNIYISKSTESHRPTQACTVITTSTEEGVYFGYNEDRTIKQFDQETYISFKAETEDNLAYMGVFAISPTVFSIRCGLNEAGIAISGNGLNQYSINPHPERTYSRDTDSIYRILLEKAHNLDEAIDLVNDFDFGSTMAFQIQAADSNGNAFVASPGKNGEIVITHKASDYFISTNTNIAEIQLGTPDYRTDMGEVLLKDDESIDKDTMRDTLECLRSDSYEGYTYYTTIFDLKERSVTFYLMQDFDTEMTLDLEEELEKSDHYYILKNLFPDGEKILLDVEAGVRTQSSIFTASRLLGIVVMLMLLRGLLLNSRKTWNADDSKNLRIKSVLIFTFWTLYLCLYVLTVVQLLPALVLTNLPEKIIETSVIPRVIQYVALFWCSGIIIAVFKLTRQPANST
jgi:predicted choloylglycine hydrolase